MDEENTNYQWKLDRPMYVEKSDERYEKYVHQLMNDGFSDTETWGLDSVISQFILPRLKRFREINNGYPMGLTIEKWTVILDQMIFAFDWSLHHEDEKYENLTKEEQHANWIRYEVGMEQFAKYFRDLWW
jgi:hypothetical protein